MPSKSIIQYPNYSSIIIQQFVEKAFSKYIFYCILFIDLFIICFWYRVMIHKKSQILNIYIYIFEF